VCVGPKLPQSLDRLGEFLGKFRVLLVLPGLPEGREARLQGRHPVLQIRVERAQFLSETADLLRIHNCLCHSVQS
jgi:hypothetical protein